MNSLTEDVRAIRRFNRFYTQKIGAVSDGFLDTGWSLSEARVLYEIAHSPDPTATEIASTLDLDPGYVSRVLKRFRDRGVIDRSRSELDRRQWVLSLTPGGRDAVESLNHASESRIRAILHDLDPEARRAVVDALGRVQDALDPEEPAAPRVTYRAPRMGDIGWIVERHALLYQASHGWDQTFEALVADIAAQFVEKFDPTAERGWIAEVEGRRAGAIALVRHSKTIGQLRLLFVEPFARGLGIGARLVSECVGQARHVGYKKMILFTVQGLHAARRLYEHEGFRLVEEKPARLWGKDELEQKWELVL
ncbi:MAG: helix-turn-helix domain-containing GNAT family N-acetyltransferase [Gemmatimonadota bacterium]